MDKSMSSGLTADFDGDTLNNVWLPAPLVHKRYRKQRAYFLALTTKITKLRGRKGKERQLAKLIKYRRRCYYRTHLRDEMGLNVIDPPPFGTGFISCTPSIF